MGVREAINKNKPVVGAIAALVVIAGGFFIVTQARDIVSGPGGAGDAFYTTDDGQNLFADDANKGASFDYGGKQAVRAHVFDCDGKQVVGYLSRFSERAVKAKAEMEAAKAAGKPTAEIAKLATLVAAGTEVKKPGPENKWVSSPGEVSRIRAFTCAAGKGAAELRP